MPSFFSKIFSDPNEKVLQRLQPMVDQINQLESKFESFSNEDLKKKTEEFKKKLLPERGRSPSRRLKQNSSLRQAQGINSVLDQNQVLPEAFAMVREAAKRTIGQRHFDEQLLAGIVLHQGKIAEQKTGEGKTLAATLAVYLNALTGCGVHLVTVNDYLARRDTNWMGPIYHLLGLTIACINHDKSYIFTPATGPDKNEVTVEMENLKEVTRQEAYQADITYGTNNEFGFDYLRDNLVQDLSQKAQRGFNFAIVDEVDSILIDEARTPLIISAPDAESTKLYQKFAQIIPRLQKDKDYEVDEKMKAVSILDSGIDKVEKTLGFKNIYQQGGIRYIHQLEQALRAHTLFKRDRDYLVKQGQVIIIDEFTGRLMPGRRFSEGLHQALEAKERVRVQEESRTLASITFQNYFRMYHKLAGMTGTALTSAEEFDKVYRLEVVAIPTHKPLIRKDRTDCIYRTEKAKFEAILGEIRKRYQKGQPVLVGTRSVERNEYLSALLKRAGIAHQVLNAKNHEKEAQIIAQAGKPGAVTVATNMAGRGVDIVLGGKNISHSERSEESREATDVRATGSGSLAIARDDVVKKDDWQELHDQVIQAGGLFVLGTERHEARRIDNQLRGRSGRQGDPGESQFFVSLEDELMRVFGGERLKNLMIMLKVPEDMPIENRMISKAIESAQSRVEGYHFDARKHTLEYDDVLNRQRRYIYQKRDEILKAKGLKEQILAMIKNEISQIVESYTAEGFDLDGLIEAVNNFVPFSKDDQINLSQIGNAPEKITDYIVGQAQSVYRDKEKELGQDKMKALAKFILLRTYDIFWMEHLDNMEHLRQSVSLRAYGHRDPLVEYKNEGARLFKKLQAGIQSEVVNLIFKMEIRPQAQPPPVIARRHEVPTKQSRDQQPPLDVGSRDRSRPVPTRKKKIGRNDPCPCGKINPQTGKPMKYKKCCGR